MTSQRQETQMQKVLTKAHGDYAKGLNARSFFKTNNHATSEDLVQNTFLKTWSFLVRGGKIEVMKAFLYHVLNGLIIDEYRKRTTSSLDALIEKGYEPTNTAPNRLPNIIDGKAAMLYIGQLPEKYHKIMRMRYSQELSLQEISLITGLTKNSISVQLHRGLVKLKLLYHRP